MQTFFATEGGRERRDELESRTDGEEGYGCQMAIASFLESYVFGPSGFWTMAPLRYAAKFDLFLSLDCAGIEGLGAKSKERKGSYFAAQRSGAIVQKPEGPNTYNL